jgi:hypothetical protein
VKQHRKQKSFSEEKPTLFARPHPAGRAGGRKAFFFEKKHQKTFISLLAAGSTSRH